MFMSALTFPRPAFTSDDELYELVRKDSQEHSEKARQFGIDVHILITHLLNGSDTTSYYPLTIIKKAELIVDWIKTNEDSCVVDFKTQETKDGKFRQPYDSWLFQLCGYWLAVKDRWSTSEPYIDYPFATNDYGGTIDYTKITHSDNTKLISLIVSSNEDIPIKAYPWKPVKVEWGCRVFLKMVEVYKIMKKI